jgi:hypothetical protein
MNAIEEILEKFKFELVYDYMCRVGWTYFDNLQTPTIARLKETARSLLTEVRKENGAVLESGGFRAKYLVNECSGPELELEFILTHSLAYVTEDKP